MITATEHMKQAGHYSFKVSLDQDRDMFELFHGRQPRDDDPFASIAACATCGVICINR